MNPAIYYLSSLEIDVPYVPTPIDMPNGQTWDQKNLNTSRYSDGTPIPRITVSAAWAALTTGGCRFYRNDSTNAALFGRLYNWYAVNGIDGSGTTKDIAPEGWRVAEESDWRTLAALYGTNGTNTNQTAGGYLKEPGTTYWQPTNSVLTPPSGFNARGGGYAFADGTGFQSLYEVGYWWPFGNDGTKAIGMSNTSTGINFNTTALPNRGFSVRLIKKDIVIDGFITTLSSYDANSIYTGGDIPITYTETISERGIVWGTSPNPNIIGQIANKIPNGDGTGSYPVTIEGLTPATTYYIRAYAIIITGSTPGTAYATEQIVITQSGLVTVETSPTITSIETNSAVGGGDITYIDPEYPISVSGLVWSTSTNPTVALTTKTTDGPTGTTTGSFTSNITGLSQTTHYYVRAYATNSINATSYGDNVEFDTIAGTQLLYAYSLRRVVPGYNGPAIRVRNGNVTGSPQFDVGFAAGTDDLDTVALLAAMSSTANGYITRFYDQNGSGKNMTTTVASREPIIVNPGKVLITQTGTDGITVRPATRWGFNFCNMQIQGVSIQSNNMSHFIVCSNTTSTASQRGIAYGGGFATPTIIFPRVAAGVTDNLFVNGASRINMGSTSSDSKIYSSLTTATGAYAWKNNVLQGTYTATIGAGVSSTVYIGYNPNTGSELFNGRIQEMLFYIGDLAPSGPNSRSSITTNAMNYYGII